MRRLFTGLIFTAFFFSSKAQDTAVAYLFEPDRVFDGEEMHEGWSVLVSQGRILKVGKITTAPPFCERVPLKGCTLLPGLIEGHSHLFLHPYHETKWDEQVLTESRAERVARAVVHARKTLEAGFTTVRDLGTEGSGYDDVGLKEAIDKGIIPGPHMLIATRAIVASGSYGPKYLSVDQHSVRGAAEADGTDALIKEVRTQIGKGADLIKIYADYRWDPEGKAAATFTLGELKRVVEVTTSSHRYVVAHASTEEGMRRAILAGVHTIEHGDGATPELFALMKEKGVALCATLSATEATESYKGWKKGSDPATDRIVAKQKEFSMALKSGVTICFGGDVGVYAHGDNAREMEAMVEYGMKAEEVLRAATSVNADVFGITDRAGRIREGMPADLLVVDGNPAQQIRAVRQVRLVMKHGIIVYKK